MNGKTPPLGTLRDRVVLQRKTTSIGADGGASVSFLPLATVWAHVKSKPGRFADQSDARTVRETHDVTIRFRDDLRSGDQILYRNDVLEIASVHDVNGRRAYLVCRCSLTQIVG